ncbi:MAG: hypothetical protein QXS20_03455 [Candidatus Thorarchaeota archaeon]
MYGMYRRPVSTKESLISVLRLALSESRALEREMVRTAETVDSPRLKALLLVFAESESKTADRIAHMIATGVVDELEELVEKRGQMPQVVTEPFPDEDGKDPRKAVCNQVLSRQLRAYSLYLRMSRMARSELIRNIFEYLAYLKAVQLSKLRRVCTSL